MDIPVEGYIAKLRLLEQAVGDTAKYAILDPFQWRVVGTIIGVQHAANTIASFLGLRGLTFVVGVVQQQKDRLGDAAIARGW